MLDDGPHTLKSMKTFITLYSQIMTDDGILIIEDVQSWDWIGILNNTVPTHLKQYIKTYDLRPIKIVMMILFLQLTNLTAPSLQGHRHCYGNIMQK